MCIGQPAGGTFAGFSSGSVFISFVVVGTGDEVVLGLFWADTGVELLLPMFYDISTISES